MKKIVPGFLLACCVCPTAHSGEANVLKAHVECASARVCRFDVTVEHADDGWDHYANRWEIRDAEGQRIAIRTLAHPHDHEQAFTRSLEDVDIPEGLTEVSIRARDSRHGHGGTEVVVKIPD
jgi:hypothetical protein